MKLMTKEIEKIFEKQGGLYAQEGLGLQSKVVVKYFAPAGAGTWLITAGERRGADWLLYGYCYINCWEWGTVMLSELESVRLPFGLRIERELYTKPLQYTVAELCKKGN